VKTIQYSGTGYMTNNSCRPNGPWPKLKVTRSYCTTLRKTIMKQAI
jgi:hypothetical protein